MIQVHTTKTAQSAASTTRDTLTIRAIALLPPNAAPLTAATLNSPVTMNPIALMTYDN